MLQTLSAKYSDYFTFVLYKQRKKMIKKFLPEKPPFAWTPEQTAAYLMGCLNRDDFYIICPDGEVTEEMDRKRILWGAMDAVKGRPALSRWHPDFAEAFAEHMEKNLPE